jgi:hypothetical protein
MSRSSSGLLRVVIPLLLFVLGCPAPAPPPSGPPPTGITFLGEVAQLAPASRASLLIQVQSPYNSRPAANANVQVSLQPRDGAPEIVFSGETDRSGLVRVAFRVPEEVSDAAQVLTVLADTEYGQLQERREVYIGRVYNIFVSTDKPVYQPGQVIHLRALALDSTRLAAADSQPITLTVADPAGNKVMRQELATSAHGVAAVDFALDAQAASGDYLITAELGPVSSTRSVEVKPYSLPQFKIDFQSDKSFYLPGETVAGALAVEYYFGKPVAGGRVMIKAFATDVERYELLELSGLTDESGHYDFEFAIPEAVVAQSKSNTASIDLEIQVSDAGGHAERVDEQLTVAATPILVEAVPEGGSLRFGLENIIYLHTSYPDGSDAATTLTVESASGISETVQTDEYGLATITLTAEGYQDVALIIHAVDGAGQEATHPILLSAGGGPAALLMRPDKAQYGVGETMNIDIHVAASRSFTPTTVYLDVVKGRQSFGLVPLPVSDGVAQAAIDIDGSLLGTLELNAYLITDRGEIVRDRRLALVNPAPATVAVEMDAEVYRPGATATLDISVSREGVAMPGVVGVAIVDESVFDLGAQDPSFARTYFLLERALQEPRYGIHGFAPLGSDDPSPYDKSATCVPSQPACEPAPSRLAVHHAQQLALSGFFAQELAALEQAEQEHASATAGETVAWGWIARFPLVLPLVGLALYDGTQRRRRLLVGLALFGLVSVLFVACAAPAPAPAAPAAEAGAVSEMPASETTATRGPAQPPRLRQFFPETLYWAPELATDAEGHVQIDVPIADSITTWRVSVLASDEAGNLGSAAIGMRVFQDFFIEPDLPRFLTVGDELDLPVRIFNYLEEPQTIRLAVASGDWFDFVEQPDLTVQIEPNEVAAAYIPIRVTGFGNHDFQVTATGSAMSDAVLRQVEVLPDGRPIAVVQNGRLATDQTIPVSVPADAVAGTPRVTVKLYPGIVSQVLDGLEGMLQQPYGCFEQTSSTTYPNVLILDYLKTTGQISPAIQKQAEQYISLGYQRLLSFEVEQVPGGFSLFGDAPPQTMLTAYGLKEFTDMSRVSYVDPALLERTANFLIQRQKGDGSWNPEGMTIESGLENLGEGNLLATAYIAAALADAGYADSEPVARAVVYLRTSMAQLGVRRVSGTPSQGQPRSPLATPAQTTVDPYVLALVANALVAANADARQELDLLVAQAQFDSNKTAYWNSSLSTWTGGGGSIASLETTALVATALLRSAYRLDIAQAAIDHLVSQRDGYGSFRTTQATVLALKALLLAAELAREEGAATVTVTLDDGRSQTLTLDDQNADVVQLFTFDDIGAGEHALAIQVEGERTIQYQVVTDYYAPWSGVAAQPQAETMRIDVRYDRTELVVNDTVNVTAKIEVLTEGVRGMLLADLGVPPGFSPIRGDLDALIAAGLIDRYEVSGRQIILYLTGVSGGEVVTVNYRLLARFPIRAQTPGSQAYDYYTPDERGASTPQRILVKLGTPEDG